MEPEDQCHGADVPAATCCASSSKPAAAATTLALSDEQGIAWPSSGETSENRLQDQGSESLSQALQDRAPRNVYHVFVGGYSEPQGHIKGDKLIGGVHSLWLERDGSLRLCGEEPAAQALPNPSMVCVDSRRRWLYSVCEASDGAVCSFHVNELGGLSFLNRVSLAGAGPCYITVDKADAFVSVATYGGGTIESFRIQLDGSLATPGQVIQHPGPAPHAHSVVMDADNTHAVVCDLGLEQLRTYSLQGPGGLPAAGQGATTQLLGLRETMQLPHGTGPSLFCFHPSGQWAYGGNETNSSVSWYRYRAGQLVLCGSYSTTPPDSIPGVVATIDVHCSPCGKFLFASNCATNTLATFRCGADDGALRLIEHTPTHGEGPRSFAIAPSGEYLLVANQDTHELVSFALDPETGRLTFRAAQSGIGSPTSVCISTPVPVAQGCKL